MANSLNSDILTFISQAATKIASNSRKNAKLAKRQAGIDSYKNDLLLFQDLSDFVEALDNVYNEWTDAETRQYMEYWSSELSLADIAFINRKTFNVNITTDNVEPGYVPCTRLINTTGGLTGGGDLSEDRTISISDGGVTPAKLQAGTDNYVLTSSGGTVSWAAIPSPSGFVSESRLISTGTGLTGGGDLSADRTISVATGGISNTLLAASGLDISKFTIGTIDAARLPSTVVLTDQDNTMGNNNSIVFGGGGNKADFYHTGTAFRADITGLGEIYAHDGASAFQRAISIAANTGKVDLHYQGVSRLGTTLTGIETQNVLATTATFTGLVITQLGINANNAKITAVGQGASNTSDAARMTDIYDCVRSFDTALRTEIVEIGDWNMDTTASVNISLSGVASQEAIRHLSVIIRNDANTNFYPLEILNGGLPSGFWSIGGSNITLGRVASTGLFDSTNFNSTSYNRGWVYLVWDINA